MDMSPRFLYSEILHHLPGQCTGVVVLPLALDSIFGVAEHDFSARGAGTQAHYGRKQCLVGFDGVVRARQLWSGSHREQANRVSSAGSSPGSTVRFPKVSCTVEDVNAHSHR